MANKQNLKPQAHKLTVDEQSRDGKRSAQVRAEKKKFKELVEIALSVENNDKSLIEIAKAYGIESVDNKSMTVLGLIRAAVGGNVSAFDRLCELIGESPGRDTEDAFRMLVDAIKTI